MSSATFTKFSVTKAVSGVGGGLVAKSDRFEVRATRRRVGDRGRRSYHVTFSVIEILSVEPRKFRDIELPATHRSDLEKILAHLASL
jgi:hypothetical protein